MRKQWLLTNDGITIWLRYDFYDDLLTLYGRIFRIDIVDQEVARFIIKITGITPPDKIVEL